MARDKNYLENKRNFIAKQRANGLCLECMNKVEAGRSRCDACLRRRNEKRLEHKAVAINNGVCIHCLKHQAIEGSHCCSMCYCRRVSYAHFATTTKWGELLAMWEAQGGKCALSGMTMTLGNDAELDHIIPLIRGGDNTLENTQWVLKSVNRMKGGLLESEMLALVESLYHHLKGR